MDLIRQTVHENLKNIAHAPSVQMQATPSNIYDLDLTNENDDPDITPDNVMVNSDRYRHTVIFYNFNHLFIIFLL